MKKFVLLILLLAASVGGLAFVLKNNRPNPAEEELQNQIRTVKAERGNIELQVPTTGKVISNLDVEIKSKASGQIVELPFDISDEVSSGALLARLDPVDENRNVIQRQSSLASAQARLAQAVQQYEIAVIARDTGTSSAEAELQAAKIRNQDAQSRLARQRDLFKKRLISKEELDAAESEAASSSNTLLQAQTKLTETLNLPRTVEMRKQDIILNQASVRQAEIDLENALQRLTETRIFAPMDGVITSRPVQTGQIIASGISNVGGGTTLMTLSDLSRIFVSANVDESDIGKISVGQSAIITTDAFLGKRFQGEIVRISPKGETNSNVVTFQVKIEVKGEGRRILKPEMTANIEVQADRRDNVVLLPNEAIQFEKGQYYVETVGPVGAMKRQVVKTGLTDGLKTEIVEGLSEGQEVAISDAVQSRWARDGDSANSGRTFSRGMRSAAYRVSRSMRSR